ncbi:ATP-dependent endonuclease [Candidatus Neomarinimicrobiota bacterium]
MKIVHIQIENFRGIAKGDLLLSGDTAFVGDNNSGKSTVLEAIDLVLGPERLSRRHTIDEHDFYAGHYVDQEGNPVEIKIEVVIVDLNEEQARHFKDNLEWWNEKTHSLLDGPPPESTDADGVLPALRVGFSGLYDDEEDDFIGNTYFLSPVRDDGSPVKFRSPDKRVCGFLFLRTHRTGSRALSLEHGSLLDVILRLQEKRLRMWEDVLEQLRQLSVAENPELGISDTLLKVQDTVRSFVPSDWADQPQMRVSDLTRENLRRILTVFMATGAKTESGGEYAAPFQHQGTGTINTLVLALLSLIAELKQNVIFAMEEPEIAIPPHTQKRIIDYVRAKSAQALFTSHSPYVLEEFDPSQVCVVHRENGILSGVPASYPPTVKPKAYRARVRLMYCEAILARRVLITEGRTEYDAIPAAARRLHDLCPDEYKAFEAMGIALVNAETDSQIAPLGEHLKNLRKIVFTIFDKQTDQAQKQAIESAIPNVYELPEKGFENLVLNHTSESALHRYALSLVSDQTWPPHLAQQSPTEEMSIDDLRGALKEYLGWSKGSGGAADLLAMCTVEEMPSFIVATITNIQNVVELVESEQAESQQTGEDVDEPDNSSEV